MPLVYRTVFTVSPPCDVVGLSLDTFSTWLAHKSDGRCPDLSRSGHHVLDHRYTVKVVRHENPAENLRFLRLKTESTHDRSGTVWQTVLTAVSAPGRASDRTVWIDMTAIPPGAEAAQERFEVVRPKLVRSFLNAARCFDGAAVLTEAPVIVRGRDTRAVDALLAAICDDSRRMAVVATVAPPDLTVVGWRMAMGQVLKSACGMYSGYVLDRAAQERVAARLPREFDIPAGGVRTFRPGVRLSDPGDHRRHPRLGMDAARTGGVIAPRIGRTLAHALREVVLDAPLPEELQLLDSLLTEEEADLSATPASPPSALGATVVYRTESAATPRPPVPAPAAPDRTAELAAEVKRRTARIADLEKERERLLAELAETAAERDRYREELRGARHENAWLREQLRDNGHYALAAAKPPAVPSDQPPDDFEELLERMLDGASFPYLRVTIDDSLDDVRELSGHKKERLWATKAWEALRALNDYVRYQLTHPGNGKTLHDYLRDQPDGFHTIPVKRMAAHESDTVQNRAKFSGKRIFRVPAEVHPDGEVPMFAHIKLDAEYGICPRLYYYPDLGPGRTNRIYIGYLGRHLPVHSTN
ncbi:MAG TPA: hypothetical protein VKZ89_09290 [Thermobifida alba]|nr:hypothetical protein [Thermobifida alba]